MRRSFVLAGLAIAALVVVAASYLASGDPDGLERVAGEHGFEDAGQAAPFEVIAGYVFPGLDGPIATIAAGLIGVTIVFGLAWLAGRVLARRRTASSPR
jgi:type IV secretory pathway VirB2 component (pilin)